MLLKKQLDYVLDKLDEMLADHFRVLADELSMRDWHVKIDPPIDPPDDVPDTRVIEVKTETRLYFIDGTNAAGSPLMVKEFSVDRIPVGTRYLAYVDKILADGGSLYWRLWKGSSDTVLNGYYLPADCVKTV